MNPPEKVEEAMEAIVEETQRKEETPIDLDFVSNNGWGSRLRIMRANRRR